MSEISDSSREESSTPLIPKEVPESERRWGQSRWDFSKLLPKNANFEIEQAQVQIPDDDDENYSFSFRKLWAFTGPGFLMCIAYLDPGNIESDLQTGAIAGYHLLWVLMWATVLGLCLQSLASRLGIVTGMNLAEHCRAQYSFYPRIGLWLMMELAIIGSDIQEVIGSAYAINLLSQNTIPIWGGVLITGLDTFTFLFMEMYSLRNLEALFGLLVSMMAVSFWYFYVTIWPDPASVVEGLIIPACFNCTSAAGEQALGIVGAVIMPHNLYLHSALVLSRSIDRTNRKKVKEANMYNLVESSIALAISFFINLAVVGVFAAAFFGRANPSLSAAGEWITEEYGSGAAVVWGIGILASGQSSTMTGTYAGQFVMEGFLHIYWPRWKRVLLTRSIAMVPTIAIALFALQKLDVVSSWLNVLQSILLPFAILPTIIFTSRRSIMGEFVNHVAIRVIFSALSVGLVFINFALIYITIADVAIPWWGIVLLAVVCVAYLAFVIYLSVLPLVRSFMSGGFDRTSSLFSQPEAVTTETPGDDGVPGTNVVN
jgi:NRAMP (natural resistance-associated macrophage protein)-like metal ion transporter